MLQGLRMPRPPRPFLPGAFFVTSCGCHAGLAPACNPSTCALGSPGSWSPLRVRVGGSSKAFDMLMHAGPSLIRACRDKPTGCTLRATDRRNFLFFSVAILAQAVVVQTAARSAGVASLEILHS